VATETIDTAELRLLGSILALVLDEQPGQAAAALETLRRRAAQSRITAGALKNLFDRVSTEAAAAVGQRTARAEAQRLQQELELVTVQASRFAAENAALQQSLAHAQQRLARYDSGEMAQRRELAGMARPAQPQPPDRGGARTGMVGGVVFALMALLLARDQSPGPGFVRRLHPLAEPAWHRLPSGTALPPAERYGPPAPP
jgi:hypothetical protein